jgi:hypothetical protein
MSSLEHIKQKAYREWTPGEEQETRQYDTAYLSKEMEMWNEKQSKISLKEQGEKDAEKE